MNIEKRTVIREYLEGYIEHLNQRHFVEDPTPFCEAARTLLNTLSEGVARVDLAEGVVPMVQAILDAIRLSSFWKVSEFFNQGLIPGCILLQMDERVISRFVDDPEAQATFLKLASVMADQSIDPVSAKGFDILNIAASRCASQVSKRAEGHLLFLARKELAEPNNSDRAIAALAILEKFGTPSDFLLSTAPLEWYWSNDEMIKRAIQVSASLFERHFHGRFRALVQNDETYLKNTDLMRESEAISLTYDLDTAFSRLMGHFQNGNDRLSPQNRRWIQEGYAKIAFDRGDSVRSNRAALFYPSSMAALAKAMMISG